jgi:hypothetical protein
VTRFLSVGIHRGFCGEMHFADPAIPSVMMLAIIIHMMLAIIIMMLVAWFTYIESTVLVAVLVISATSFWAWGIIRIRQIWIAGLSIH